MQRSVCCCAGLLGHGRRVVAGDFPLAAIPAVGVGIAGLHFLSGLAEGEGVQAGVDGFVAADLHVAQVDFAGGAVFHEVHEVVFDFCGRAAWLVGNGGQQDGAFVIQGYNVFGVACLQGCVPAVEQGGDFGFGGFFARGRIHAAGVRGHFRIVGGATGNGSDSQHASGEFVELLHDDSSYMK